ncbi:MAG: glycoside hydrolase family 10 protein [Thermoanaerobaculia bacterium]
MRRLLALSFLFLAACATTPTAPPPPPELPREFRGVWVATVKNIDWPSRPGLTRGEQQREILEILDRARALNFNAVVLQVRPAADALYSSNLEPWSEYLTGTMGQDPGWDPLAFAVAQAHARGLELHAWFNPYRARHAEPLSPPAPKHISVTHPHLVRTYGSYLWMDPGEEEVRRRTREVILDVVSRYDVDGVHLDDYFYPYPENDASGTPIEFPDDAAWFRYLDGGGTLSRAAWRRANVDTLIRELWIGIHREKPWVKFGVSPFGIWRPGNPPGVVGFDAYERIHADSKRWLEEGWVDYFAPQLYWPIASPGQPFRPLLAWWLEQNPKERHVWPGITPNRIANGRPNGFYPEEILHQIALTRELGSNGTIHFSMRTLMQDRAAIATRLAGSLYAEPALVPASPWLDTMGPIAPIAAWDPINGELVMTYADEEPFLWAVRIWRGGDWRFATFPGRLREIPIGPFGKVIVNAVDRVGNASTDTVVDLTR